MVPFLISAYAFLMSEFYLEEHFCCIPSVNERLELCSSASETGREEGGRPGRGTLVQTNSIMPTFFFFFCMLKGKIG